MKLTGKSLVLLLLYPSESGGSQNSIAGRTRLMKMGYLFEKEIWPDFKGDTPIESVLPDFYAWKYGPFSSQLLSDLEFLINRNYVESVRGNHATKEELEEYKYWLDEISPNAPNEYVEEIFSLTEKGLTKAASLWSELSPNQRSLLGDFSKVMVSAPLTKILEYVYKKYRGEGVTDRSLIRDRYLRE